MDKHDARRIAETANALRPDWPIGSLMTLLAEHRNKDALDVHLAVVWIAYDDTIESPAILRAEGPWWKLRRSTALGAPTLEAPPDTHRAAAGFLHVGGADDDDALLVDAAVAHRGAPCMASSPRRAVRRLPARARLARSTD